MSGIAGILGHGQKDRVSRMLDRLVHRGPAGREILETDVATLGVVWTRTQADARSSLTANHVAQDRAGAEHLAQAQVVDGRLILTRDALGVAPLYYGYTREGLLCFASEVKALQEVTSDVQEFPPGHRFDGERWAAYFRLEKKPPLSDSPEAIAKELRRRLATAVEQRIQEAEVGSWLSGGLDSSTIAALARPHVERLYTFAVGLEGAPDLEYARVVARFLGAEHHEQVVQMEDLLAVLPDVIYHLESFDALLVRSSLTNYLVARAASEYTPVAFSGEGGDELFAGYAYLKSLDPADLPDELIDITGRLHNTALQRVDRCASAHGLVVHVPFLDPDVVDYALRIPAMLKLHDGVEKWILRRAMDGLLPESILTRAKAKFWEGANVGDLLAQYAEERISDREFARERRLPDGQILNTKEELLYYRIFREYFPDLRDLSWVGRTKGAPVQPVEEGGEDD